MLTLEAMKRILDEVTYGDWELWADDDSPEGIRVHFYTETKDSRNPAHKVDLHIEAWPGPNDRASIEAFLGWLSWRLQRVANHECREHLRYRGECIDNPHVVLPSHHLAVDNPYVVLPGHHLVEQFTRRRRTYSDDRLTNVLHAFERGGIEAVVSIDGVSLRQAYRLVARARELATA